MSNKLTKLTETCIDIEADIAHLESKLKQHRNEIALQKSQIPAREKP